MFQRALRAEYGDAAVSSCWVMPDALIHVKFAVSVMGPFIVIDTVFVLPVSAPLPVPVQLKNA